MELDWWVTEQQAWWGAYAVQSLTLARRFSTAPVVLVRVLQDEDAQAAADAGRPLGESRWGQRRSEPSITAG